MQASSLASWPFGVLAQTLQGSIIQICPASCRGPITEHETFYPLALIVVHYCLYLRGCTPREMFIKVQQTRRWGGRDDQISSPRNF